MKNVKVRANTHGVIMLTAFLVLVISLAWQGIEYIIQGEITPSKVDDYVALMIYLVVFLLVYRISIYRQTLLYMDLRLKQEQLEQLIKELDEKKYSYLFRQLKELEGEYQAQFKRLSENQHDYVEFRSTSLKAKKRIAYYQTYFKEKIKERVRHGSRYEQRQLEEQERKKNFY